MKEYAINDLTGSGRRVGKFNYKYLTFRLTSEQTSRILQISNNHEYSIFTILTTVLICQDILKKDKNKLYYDMPYLRNEGILYLNEFIRFNASADKEMSFKQVLYQTKEQFLNLSINRKDESVYEVCDKNAMPLIAYNTIHDLNCIQKSTASIQYLFYRNDDNLMCILKYDSNIYGEQYIKDCEKRYQSVLEYVINNPDEPMHKAEQKDVAEVVKINERVPLTERIKNIAEKFPSNIALDYQNTAITYRELLKRANKLALILRKNGVDRNCIVGVYIDNSIEMIVGILGILMAGGCYLPLDPATPKERVSYILNDCNTEVMVTLCKYNSEFDEKMCVIDVDTSDDGFCETEFIENINEMEDAAYIIYTSGTTGKPKGAIVTHENVFNLMYNSQQIFDFSNNDTWVMFHSYSFDFSVWEIYGALFFGGKLVLLPKEYTTDLKKLLMELREKEVTILNQTPLSFANMSMTEMKIPDAMLKLRYIIFGGDKLNPSILMPWKNKYSDVLFVNMYGITETTVHVTFKKLSDEDIMEGVSNIGKALPGVFVYVKSDIEQQNDCGELYVGGTGVCRGYLNNPELTHECFVTKDNNRMYKSGDLVRIKEKGDIEYQGRGDHQVKIRGFRIELGEINSVLLRHHLVKNAVTTINQEDENKYIVSYVVLKEHIEINEIREFLKKYLHDYMIPAYIYAIDEIPLNVNGKVDYNKLPKGLDIRVQVETKFLKCENQVEEDILSIWREVLNADHIGTLDNFFEIGGNSYKVVICHTKLEEKFSMTFSVSKMFQYPTIKLLAEFIQNQMEKVSTNSTEIVEEKFNEIEF